jgi:bifunctional UDP-N-acetylglucosamine pyrophosphorylase / glucosamine-1-phosphate N-acetyltransferase
MNRVMIVPAAGLGSRLSPVIPKVLYPVNGRPMIDYLFDLYSSVVEQFIFVLHPSFEREVRRHCSTHRLRIEYEIQEKPTGMLDAILIPRERVQRHAAESVWVTWCDQIAVHPQTIGALANLSRQNPATALIFPTITRKEPYIHLVRNDCHEIVNILQRREGDNLPQVGESDMGLFCLSSSAYLERLRDFSREIGRAAVTQERNFLPFISWLHGRAEVRTFPGHGEIESVGINTPPELRLVEDYLRVP